MLLMMKLATLYSLYLLLLFIAGCNLAVVLVNPDQLTQQQRERALRLQWELGR